jgi:septal ring factor EnvC (AmiA/AmiB activator)
MSTRPTLPRGAILLVAAALSAAAAPHATAADAAQAKAAFAAARDELRECVSELTTLQADYQKPGADKQAIEAKFNATKTRAQAANNRLEASAFEASTRCQSGRARPFLPQGQAIIACMDFVGHVRQHGAL